MEYLVPLWILAMIAGICWARWAVMVLTAVMLAGALGILVFQRAIPHQPIEWLELVVILLTPWLVAAQRLRYGRQLRRLQAKEASRLARQQDKTRLLSQIQRENQELETQVAKISDLYHVTKETARALRVDELFTHSLDIIPRLLSVQGLRLVDLTSEEPLVLRARRAPDGRLMPEQARHLAALEQEVVAKMSKSSTPSVAESGSFECPFPEPVTRIAWAPLWGERRPIGVLIAEELPVEQLDTLKIVANQLSLQLARVHFYQAIETMAVTDSLTSVFVRRYFLELAAEELVRAQRHKLPCAVLMVDLDLFKAKNDTYGHLVGDTVLREVARILKQNLREIDLMARYGGEEFIIMLVESGCEQAMQITERLRQIVESTPIRAYDEDVRQTISLGLGCYPEDGADLQTLIDRADQALYASKQAGRNQAQRWTAKVGRPAAKRA